MLRRMAFILPAAALLAVTGCTSSSSKPSGSGSILIGLNVPVTADPYVAGVITRGATLAADEANAAGGVKVGGRMYRIDLKTYDDNDDPAQAATNVERAISDGAVAVVEDGIGMPTSAAKSTAAGVPEIAITDGNSGLLTNSSGPVPSLFGLRIPNNFAADVLATYLTGKATSVAVLHDDSDNGRDGSDALSGSLQESDITAKPVIEVAAASPAMDAQALEIKNAHPGAVAIWGGDQFIARAISALRSAGVTAPIYTSQQGESPAVRALNPITVTDGVKFVSGRMDSESDNCSFPKFEDALGTHGLAPVDAHLKTSAGQEVRQPDDVDFFSYDAVNVVVAALQKLGGVKPGPQLLLDMTQVSVTSANGDARGFDSQAHEAFAFEDAYVAAIHDNQFEPVKDEALAASLATEPELMSQYPVPVPTSGCPS